MCRGAPISSSSRGELYVPRSGSASRDIGAGRPPRFPICRSAPAVSEAARNPLNRVASADAQITRCIWHMVTLTVNGTTQNIDADADTPLLWVLRDHLSLTGTK